MEKYIAAIDLGTKKVAAAVGELTPSGVKIIGYTQVPSRGMKRGRIENPQLASNAVKDALKKLESDYGLKIEKAYIGEAGHDIKCVSTEPIQTQRNAENELITAEEIENITKGMEKIPFDNGYTVLSAIPQSFNVDNNMSVSQAVGMFGRVIVSRYKLLIGKEAFSSLAKNTMRLAGLKQTRSVIEPIAAAQAVLTNEERDAGVVVVDIGGGTTDVIVIQNDIVRHVGIVPFGGDSVTNDICCAYKIAPKQAESLKINYGCCFSDYADSNKSVYIKSLGGKDIEIQIKTLSKIIQARMEEIVEAIAYHVDQSGFSKNIRAGYVLTGGGAQFKHLPNLVNYITGKDARIETPSKLTISADSLDTAKTCEASTAVGLVLYGFQKMKEGGDLGFVTHSTGEDVRIAEEKVNENETVAVEKDETAAVKVNKKEGKKGSWLKSLNLKLFPDDENLNAV